MRRRRGIVLLVVLAIIAVLGLLAGTFAFRMNAELAAVKASADLQQARLAARSGIDRMIHLLRTDRTNVDAWYDNPDYFRRVPVWVEGDETLSASPWEKDPVPGRAAWRYSIPSTYEAPPGTTDEKNKKMRYGLTDEASKINIANLANKALRAQVLSLLDQVRDQVHRENFVAEVLADSLIDWQDADNTPNSLAGAESDYYYRRSPRYRAKNRPLQSLDELLMIRGWDGLVLYGEDANRNCFLDPNEDDGANEIDTFPPDNGDGSLYRGLLPYITVHSWDWNTSAKDNKAKIPLNAVSMKLLDEARFQYLTEEISPATVQFIEDARKAGYTFRSVGELLGLQVHQGGKSNYTKAWKDHDALVDELNADRKDTGEQEGENENQNPDDQGGQDNRNPDDNDGENGDPDQGDDQDQDNNKSDRQRQSVRSDDNQNRGGTGGNNNAGPDRGGNTGRNRGPTAGNRDGRGDRPSRWSDQQREFSERRRDRGPTASEPEEEDELQGEPLAVSPISEQEMIAICDRFTVETVPVIPGLINVNTASAIVLRTIPGLTEEQVTNIIAQRQQLTGEEKSSIGWLVAYGVVDPETFALISNMLTTRSIQFSADVIGFADHTGTFKRFEVVVEMRGHLAQIVYFRDISSLGAGYPVWDDEKSEGLSYDDR